ncbi:LacI family DNA-binding transcriptional regulator [Mesobacillus maritimus]|uniref:LacI family DNA-binding transcriptional regulator n=1 Tax=Mesobacillus maritimus TaxID=1643336 RepID=UPI00384DAC29
MTTIKDVAKLASVSISTVSRVLNNSGYTSEETKKKVFEAVENLNFRKNIVAAAMINKQTSTFGLIIPDIKNVFYADLTRAVEDAANQHGFNVILCNTDNDLKKEAEYISFLLQKGIDGIIFSTPEIKNRNIKEVIKSRPDLPIVILGSKVVGVQVDEVLVDNFEGAYNATIHLLELGHKKIGFIAGQPDSYATIERQKGYEAALEEYQLSLDLENIMLDEFKVGSGYNKGKEMLLRKNRPTAIFAGNDAIAVGVYKAARELDIQIPEELSIVGFDDSQYAEIVYPSLTTVRTPVLEMGEKAIEMGILLSKKNKKFKETITFQPELIVRSSTSELKVTKKD